MGNLRNVLDAVGELFLCTDGSGGPFGGDPILRRGGWAWCIVNGMCQVLFAACGFHVDRDFNVTMKPGKLCALVSCCFKGFSGCGGISYRLG